MITGILAVLLFILVCLRGLEKRLKSKRRIFAKIHTAASIILIVVSIVHIIVTFPLLSMRPVSVLITGALCLLFILACFFSGFKRKFKAHRIFALCAGLCLILHVFFNLHGLTAYRAQVKDITIRNVDVSQIPDGVYTGECDVTFIYAKVEVTVRSGVIADIAILEHRNDLGTAAEKIADDIVHWQTIDVDAVSGATNSSTVIKKAVENALSS